MSVQTCVTLGPPSLPQSEIQTLMARMSHGRERCGPGRGQRTAPVHTRVCTCVRAHRCTTAHSRPLTMDFQGQGELFTAYFVLLELLLKQKVCKYIQIVKKDKMAPHTSPIASCPYHGGRGSAHPEEPQRPSPLLLIWSVVSPSVPV